MVFVILSHNLHALFSSLFLHLKYFLFFSVALSHKVQREKKTNISKQFLIKN